jgi:hypothetical protein
MSDGVLAAIIAAIGAVVVAVIGLYGRPASQREPVRPTTAGGATSTGVEEALRRDRRVQRLLRNDAWRDTAEAAIAHLCRGANCPVDSWRQSSTWQQVATVHAELAK